MSMYEAADNPELKMYFLTFFWRWHLVEVTLADKLQLNDDKFAVCSIWKGHVIGGGVGITFKNRFRLATETAKFNLPETHIYFGSDDSALSFLPHFKMAALPRALYIALTMARI